MNKMKIMKNNQTKIVESKNTANEIKKYNRRLLWLSSG